MGDSILISALAHDLIPHLKFSSLQVSWNNPLTHVLHWKTLALRSKCSGAHYSNQAMLARCHVLPHKRSGFKVQLFRISSQNSIRREYMCFLRSLLLHRMLWQKADSKHLNILWVSLNPALIPMYTNVGDSGWVWHMHHRAVRLSAVALCHHGWAVEGLWKIGTCSLTLDCALWANFQNTYFETFV